MAVNPLYRNEYYFFSGMYDDSLITDFYRKITSESYDRSVLYQHNMLGRKRNATDNAIFYKSTIGELVIDDDYNRENNLPVDTRTLKLNTLILPIFHKRKFYNAYGLVNQRIPIIDFYKRNDIFDKVIILQIGGCRIFDAILICNDDNTITLAIENSATTGISSTNMDKFISDLSADENIWIFSEENTQVYFNESNSTEAFSLDSKGGFYEIKVPLSKAINKIGTSVVHEVSNSWDCLITYKANKYGKKLFASCPCSLKQVDATNAVFYVNDSFINFIKVNTYNFCVYFIHRPNRKHILMYQYTQDSSPILSLDYTYNPSGNINIEVYELDMKNMCKGRKLYDTEFTQVYFPNIFDFHKLNRNNTDLMIEVTEYYPTYTNQVMANSISPLIDSLGPEFYTEFVVNKYDTSISGISTNLQKYHPTHYPVSVDDYMDSEYYGNYRGYMLDKIEKTISSDPYLLAYYYRWMNQLNGLSISTSGTPKDLQFGTGMPGEFGGNHEIVMDTRFISKSATDIIEFSEPHSYLTYHTAIKDSPSMVFVNGKYVRPTYSKTYKDVTYLFFPVEMIKREMSKYSTDQEIIQGSPITLDIYPKSYTSPIESPITRVNISSTSDSVQIFQGVDNPEFSIAELIVYDETTGKYLGSFNDIFNIKLMVSNYIIENPGATEDVAVALDSNINSLLTLLNEMYCTKDGVPIILGSSDKQLSWNDFIDEMVDNGIISNEDISVFTHKRLNFENIEISLKDESLIGADIAVYSSNFKNDQVVNSDSGIYDSENNVTYFEVNRANIDPNLNRYCVYVDGHLDHSASISMISNTHSSNLSITFVGDLTSTSKEIVLVHMPIEYYRQNFDITSRVFYMKEGNSAGKDVNAIWPIDAEDGVILQYRDSRICNSYPFEDSCNIKYTSDGLRLPPKNSSTNRMYGEYLTAARASLYNISDGDSGIAFFMNTDVPFTDLAKQNPYSNECDLSLPMNPLDILTHF